MQKSWHAYILIYMKFTMDVVLHECLRLTLILILPMCMEKIKIKTTFMNNGTKWIRHEMYRHENRFHLSVHCTGTTWCNLDHYRTNCIYEHELKVYVHSKYSFRFRFIACGSLSLLSKSPIDPLLIWRFFMSSHALSVSLCHHLWTFVKVAICGSSIMFTLIYFLLICQLKLHSLYTYWPLYRSELQGRGK